MNEDKNMNEEDKNKELYEDQTFHPSIDFKDGIFLLGFRVKTLKKEKNVFLIALPKKFQLIENADSFETDGKKYYLDLNSRVLGKVSRAWSYDELKNLFSNSNSDLYNVNSLKIFNKILDCLKEHVEFENEADYILSTAWIIGTYLFPIFSSYPYLHIKAPKGSGKSETLKFLKLTTFNAVKARASLPAFRDTADSLRGTFLIDQADALHRRYMEEMLDILTDSYKKGGGDTRIKDKGKDGRWTLMEFQTYCPKGFASIHPLPEDLRDRCIVIPLTKSDRNLKYLDEEEKIWKEIRSDLYKLAISDFNSFYVNYEIKKIEYRNNNSVIGRKLELWLPLEVILQGVGVSTEKKTEAKERLLSQYNISEFQASELEIAVIENVHEEVKPVGEIILSPKHIAENLDSNLFEDFPSLKQKSAEVGKIINKFNLQTKKLSRDRSGERYLFHLEKVVKVANSYLGLDTEQRDTSHTQIYTDENNEPTQGSF